MKRSVLYRFFLLFVFAGFFLSCGNPVYTAKGGGDEGGADEEGPELLSISITRFPSKTAYEWGEELDISGLEVAGVYSDGSVQIENVSRDNIYGYNRTTEGVQRLKISIQGKTAAFEVIVWNFIKIKVNNPFSSIEVILPPGSTGQTSNADWDIRVRHINGSPVSLTLSPGVDGCNILISGTLPSGTYEITVIFRRKYSERIQIQV